MSNLVGRVHFSARLRGEQTERDAKNIGDRAGKAAGKGYDDAWKTSLRDSLTREGKAALTRFSKNGKSSGTAFGQAFDGQLKKYLGSAMRNFNNLRINTDFLDNFSAGFKDAGLAAGELQEQLNTLRETNQITDKQFEAARKTVDKWALSQRNAAEESTRSILAYRELREEIGRQAEAHKGAMRAERERDRVRLENLMGQAAILDRINAREAERIRIRNAERSGVDTSSWSLSDKDFDKITAAADRASRSVDGFSLKWKDLSHNTRQWTLIIGAVLSGMQDISVLGSAAGAGLIAVGGAAVSGIAGIGGLAAVFVTLNKDLEDLPANLRPVKREFDEFKSVFGDLRTAVASGAFSEMSGTFSTLERNLRSLSPEMSLLGKYVGQVFDDLADGTREGTDGLAEIRKAVRLAGPDFKNLSNASGTWGTALLRSMNRANPMVDQLIGYVDLLGKRFDAFSRSSSFDDWIRRSMGTWSQLGKLLDATGRTLNDLVTPQSVLRTRQFLDNLTEFMPSLTNLLGLLGGFDVFGVAAALLNDLGRGLAPLAPASIDLAEALSRVAMIVSNELGDALSGIAIALAPTVQMLADFLDALPPDAIAGITNTILLLAGAFVILKGARGIGAAISAIQPLVTNFLPNLQKQGDRAVKSVTAMGRAGMWGSIAVGAGLGAQAIVEFIDKARGIDDISRNLVGSNASLVESYDKLRAGNGQLTQDFDKVLGRMGDLGNFFVYTASGFDKVGIEAVGLAGVLKELDGPLSAIAQQDLSSAISQFQAYATELGATDQQMLTMIGQMEGFKEVLAAVAQDVYGAATDQNILKVALGESEGAARANEEALTGMGESAGWTSEKVDALADKIRGFGSDTLSTRDAQRQFEASFDDLSASIRENGVSLDVGTEAGRANEKAIDDLVKSTLEFSASLLEETGSQDAASAAIKTGRDRLIEMLDQLGITGAEAEAYADKLELIPEDVYTKANLDVTAAQRALDGFILSANRRTFTIYGQSRVAGPTGGNVAFASGGLVNGPTRALVGEAGREAIIPLDRPLMAIDPSVRWLAAVAQGKVPAFGAGGVAGNTGKQITIAAGAIVVHDNSGDPRRTAQEVVDRIAEDVAG